MGFMKNDFMLIGELADFFGVSRKAIRVYEKKGIIKPAEIDEANGYRYYSAEQVQQMNAVLELKAMGFSLDEIKTVIDGETTREQLIEALVRKQQAWREAMDAAKYKAGCIENIIHNLQHSQAAEKMTEMTEEERAWLLVKMVCVEEIRIRNDLSEALWL